MTTPKFGRLPFKLDAGAPLRRQIGEPERAYAQFWKWKESGWSDDFSEVAEILDMKVESIDRINRKYEWKKRRDLDITRRSKPLGEQLYGTKTPTTNTIRKTARNPSNELLAPPEPIAKGLHRFALEYAHVICPGFEMDALVELMLTELEELIEGMSGRLMINPSPRSSKTTCAILALCYSLLRYPDRGHILISSNGRLAAMNSQKMKTLFEYSVPEGHGIRKDTKSKIAWAPSWEGGREQVAASRGGALLGYTGHIVLVDDIIGNIAECESVDIMDAAMRTIGVDIQTRLTKDKVGKGAGLCLIAQRLGPSDPTARLIDRDKGKEKAGDRVVPWRVVASPFLCPSKERAAEINGDYPHSWHVMQPRYREVGQPVSTRFTRDFADSLQAQMPPADWASMYELDCSVDVGYCSWRRSYLVPIANEDIQCRGSFIALDLNLSGDKGSDTSALVAAGVQDQKAVVLGVHALSGYVEDALPQILDYADRYNAVGIGVEKAAGGHHILRSLNNNVAGRTFNVTALSHEGRSKRARQQKILGLAANGKILIRDDIPLIEVLHQQQRSIALDKKRDPDDYADALNYAVDWINTHWLSSGFTPGDVRWAGGGGGSPGITEVTWGRGSSAGFVRPGIDGNDYYQAWN